ncbi:MAG: benzoyl-CoA reductase subunit A [Acidobacteria bacterium]|nr:benzoyl-CoA reductase subunit A [Acidobacteriota bacterium]
MKCAVGIDLGSTTTKAVALDPLGRILGRGITNSRNNYDAACAIAQNEALIDARFTLVRRALATPAGAGAESFVDHLTRCFRLEQHLDQLAQLREATLGAAERLQGSGGAPGLRGTVEGIFDSMKEGAGQAFARGAKKRSDFFRDLAGGTYLSLAEKAAPAHGIPFETLAGLFDKSILAVENRTPEENFRRHIDRALDRALRESPPADRREESRLRSVVAATAGEDLEVELTVGTGYGRARLPFPKEQIRFEILCHGLGAHTLFPGTATVLDIGGQDTKAIQIDDAGIVTSFQMNDRCAAGCGRYLGYIADELNLGLHELGPLAQTATRSVKISSTCTVFAGAEIRDRLTMGQKREDILLGLHRAIILRAMALLARSGGIRSEFTFTGGVAKNPAAVDALAGLVRENYGEVPMNVSADSIFTGALGAALFARRAADATASSAPGAAS